MDDILEFIFELIIEVIGSVIESDSVPKFVRYLLIALITVPILIIIYIAVVNASNIALLIFLAILALGLISLCIYLVYSINKSGTLVRAKKEDLSSILKLYRSVLGKPGCTWNISYPNEVNLHEDYSNGNLYILRKGKKLIGAGSIVTSNELDDLECWTYKEDTREIARIVIAPEYQGKGYGKHLVNKLCNRLDCKAVHILVAAKNHHALNLYRNTGFKIKAQCTRYGADYFAHEKKI